jgi:hypothetical protein
MGPFGVLFFYLWWALRADALHVCVLLSEALFLLSDLDAEDEIYSGYFELMLGMCAFQAGRHKLLTKRKRARGIPGPSKI